ncbi:MAG: UDP-3-O-[3-hydroxymyristoyl] N-acetylglucosamine deacetylase [Oligoflexales bacterium]|nr:UDP-3-O-[3-hydroxymyristoyl] N-acetylglucosamine deacetylase [Oligoflexales bacterium]
MSIFLQGTIAKAAHFAGVGLHSGKLVNLSIHPQAPDTGIIFQRTDLLHSILIPAHPDQVVSTQLCTTLGHGTIQISTVEHLMAALFGLGIDNALVRVDSEEIPILDGSAAPFVDRISEAGIQVQPAKRRWLYPHESFEVRNGDQFMRIDPLDAMGRRESEKHPILDLECSIDFPSRAIGKQKVSLRFSEEEFLKLAEARTFCHADSVQAMRKQGLALGGSLDNAVVVNDSTVLNAEGLRSEDEFARHKLLDAIGDLALLGARLAGKITIYKGGHSLHVQFVKKAIEHFQQQNIRVARRG